MHKSKRFWAMVLAPICFACPLPSSKPGQLPPIVTRIVGTVFDDGSGLPLAGVGVHTEPATENVTTGADGTFAFAQGITPRTVYRITATKAGYLAGQAGFATVEGNDTQVDISLVPAAPLAGVSRDTLDFGAFDSSLSFALSNDGDSEAGLEFQITSSAAWVKKITPATGTLTAPVAVVVELDRALLGAPFGVRTGTIDVTTNGGAKTVALRLDNPDPAKPYIALSPLTLDFGLAGAERTVLLRNAGTGTLHWKAVSSVPWITVSKLEGDLLYGPYELLTLNADRFGLPEGHETATVTVSATDNAAQEQVIHLTADIGGAPVTAVSPSLVDFGTQTAPRTFTVRNSGYGTLRYEIEPPPVEWLAVTSPEPGTWLTLAAGQSQLVTLTLRTGALTPGSHETPLIIRSDENPDGQPVAGGNRSIAVRAELANVPVLEASRNSVSIGTAASATVTLSNTGWGVASYSVTNKPAWLTVTPSAADIVTPFGSPPQEQELVLSVDRTGLSVGPYSGSIHIDSAAGNQDIAVSMTANGSVP